jgi:hypothetical protein
MNNQPSLKEMEHLVKKLFKEDLYPKELPNGMWEIAKGVFTNKKGLEEFSKELRKTIKEHETNRK